MSEQPKIEVPEGARAVERDTGKMHEYRSGEWMPVEDGEYDAQHITDSYLVEGEYLTVQEGVIGKGDTVVATIALPDHIRLCKRVDPEAITPDTLQREGWHCPIQHWLPPDADSDPWKPIIMVSTWSSRTRVFMSLPSGKLVPIPGATTMQDLRTLVRFLGGES